MPCAMHWLLRAFAGLAACKADADQALRLDGRVVAPRQVRILTSLDEEFPQRTSNTTGRGHPQSEQCSCIKDVDIPGGNIMSSPMSSPEDCCHVCSMNPRCEVFVFMGTMCWLKNLTRVTTAKNRLACFPHAHKLLAHKAMVESFQLTGIVPPLKEISAGSCKVYGCGSFDHRHDCQCNPGCHRFGDCCDDFTDAGCPAAGNGSGGGVARAQHTCKNRECHGYFPRYHCQCNNKCTKYKNCCSDREAFCSADAEDADPAQEVKDSIVVRWHREQDAKKSNAGGAIEAAHGLVLKKFKTQSTQGQLAGARSSSLMLMCCILTVAFAANLLIVGVVKGAHKLFRRRPAVQARGMRWAQGEDDQKQLLGYDF